MSALPSRQPPRIAGLDTIRFFCALAVVFFHFQGPPLFHGLSRDTPSGRIILGLYDAAFNGQAAVIAFFVISGFCIHLPYASGRRFAAGPFLLGRAARILIPTGAYLLLLRLLHHSEAALTLILWSIWCEIIYYFLYPFLRAAFARSSVIFVLLCAYIAAAIVTAGYAFGPEWQALFAAGRWTWLAGLPCWILGCLLAERVAQTTSETRVSPTRLWTSRLAAWGLASACYLAMLHSRVSFLVSLQVFAGFTYFWLTIEIGWYREHAACRPLEWLGGLTFSIYLLHQLAKLLLESHFTGSGWLWWIAEMVSVLGLSAVFYALVEAPSHRLARTVMRRAKSQRTPLRMEDVNPVG
ncbi:MAG: acyltransferase [Chthoniobacter sp.]|uniref:acyltransferase family protein n=1 Tax=Chthoniobacter sp. TaxID=2510640 RepID=UPI0032A73B8A